MSNELQLEKIERARFTEVFKNKMDCTLVNPFPERYYFKNKATQSAFWAWLEAKKDAKEQAGL